MGLFTKKKEEERSLSVPHQTAMTVPPVTEETVDEYMKAFGLTGDLKDHEVQAFRHMATMFNLNPFKREIHCNAYGEGQYRTLTIVTGYEVYISKAERSGRLEYWSLEEAPPDTPIEKYYATLTVKRKDRQKEQKWTSYYAEAVQRRRDGKPNSVWGKQPRFMTKKVAISQGFRLFFEDVMHGMPYTEEEYTGEEAKDVTPDPQPVATRPVKEAPVAEEQAEETGTEEKEVDYKVKILDLINEKGKIPDMQKVQDVVPAFRECKSPEDFKELYRKICEDYNIT